MPLTDLLTFFVVTFKGRNQHAVHPAGRAARTIRPPAQGQATRFTAPCNIECNCIAGLFET